MIVVQIIIFRWRRGRKGRDFARDFVHARSHLLLDKASMIGRVPMPCDILSNGCGSRRLELVLSNDKLLVAFCPYTSRDTNGQTFREG